MSTALSKPRMAMIMAMLCLFLLGVIAPSLAYAADNASSSIASADSHSAASAGGNTASSGELAKRNLSRGTDDSKSSGGSDDPDFSGGSDDQEPSGGSDDPKPSGGSNDSSPSSGSDDPSPSGGSGDPSPSGSSEDPTPSGGSDDPTPSSGSDEPDPSSGSSDPKPSGESTKPDGGKADSKPYPYPSGTAAQLPADIAVPLTEPGAINAKNPSSAKPPSALPTRPSVPGVSDAPSATTVQIEGEAKKTTPHPDTSNPNSATMAEEDDDTAAIPYEVIAIGVACALALIIYLVNRHRREGQLG